MQLKARATPENRWDKLQEKGVSVHWTPALTANYAIDDASLMTLHMVSVEIGSGLGLPLGTANYRMLDRDRNIRILTPVQVQTLYKALRDYAYAFKLFREGRLPSAPTQPITIP